MRAGGRTRTFGGPVPGARRVLAKRRRGQSTARHAISAPSAYDTTPARLDPSLLRQDPAALAERLRATRGFELDAAAVERLEAARKRIQVRTQELQNLRNTRSKAIGQAKAKGEDASALLAEVAGFGDELKASEAELDGIRAELDAIVLGIPNLPDESVPAGKDESDNVEQARWGTPRSFDFKVLDQIGRAHV